MNHIAVVGSLNRDLVVELTAIPAQGVTLLAEHHHEGWGGKGANQAITAARLGVPAKMVGAVGDDSVGDEYRALLESEGVGVDDVITSSQPTGLAVILVEPDGHNRIVVSPGANHSLGTSDISRATETITTATVLLAQLEVPVETIGQALRIAAGTRILNAAPAQPLPRDLLDLVDVLIVNEHEVSVLAGDSPPPTTVEQAVRAASSLNSPGTVIVTLGGAGCVVHPPTGRWWHQPAYDVIAVDTTAAGDAFCGAIAAELSTGASLRVAVERATLVSAMVVTRRGAVTALPTAEEVSLFGPTPTRR